MTAVPAAMFVFGSLGDAWRGTPSWEDWTTMAGFETWATLTWGAWLVVALVHLNRAVRLSSAHSLPQGTSPKRG